MGARGAGCAGGVLRAAIAAALGLTLSFGAGEAGADGLADEAEVLFQIGLDAYQRGDYQVALQNFLHSNRLVPNRNVVFNVALVFEKTKRYADAYRYYIDALQGETDANIIKEIQSAIARVSPSIAVLRVETIPKGATIYIDRRDLGSRGTSPRPLAMQPGRYKVMAELEGYEPAEAPPVDIELGAERRVELTLKRIVGAVRVEVKGAPSAEVRADDESAPPACLAPCRLELSPGLHRLYFKREGYQAPPQQIFVTAGQTASVTAECSPLLGSLLVSSDERDALVEVDGRPAGFTPAVIPNVPVGTRRVRVTLRGYEPVLREAVVEPNRESKLLDIPLSPLREVTAVSRLPEDIDDAPSSVTIIDGRELRAFGYPTVAEAVRGVRGVYVTDNYVNTSVGVRGLGDPNDYNNRILLLSDGQTLNENVIGAASFDGSSRTDLYDIERIEVVRGPGSLLYGTGAFSGVINLVTRAHDEPSRVEVSAGTYDNSVARGRARLHYNVRRDAGVWASVSAARSLGVNLEIVPEPGHPNSAARVARGVRQSSSVSTSGQAWWGALNAQWLYHRGDYSIPAGEWFTILNDPRTGSAREAMMAELRFEPRLTQNVQLTLRAHANRHTADNEYAFEPEPAETTKEYYKGTWFGAEGRILYAPRPKMRLVLGIQGQVHPEASVFGAFPGDQVYLDFNEGFGFGAAYGLFEGSLSPWLRVSAGLRADIYSFGPIALPRAAIILRPSRESLLKIMGGRAFRAPSPYELYYEDGGISQVTAVMPDRGLNLGPESIYSGEIEYSYRLSSSWVALASAHISYIQDLIGTLEDAPGSDLVRYQNTAIPSLANGGDLEIRREWRQGWMMSAMYTYQRAQFLESGLPNPRLVNAPEHSASLKAVVPIMPDIASLGGRISMESPRRIDVVSNDTTQAVLLADLSLSGAIKRFGLEYSIAVYNIGDWRYSLPTLPAMFTDTRVIAQSGRTFLADVRVSYP